MCHSTFGPYAFVWREGYGVDCHFIASLTVLEHQRCGTRRHREVQRCYLKWETMFWNFMVTFQGNNAYMYMASKHTHTHAHTSTNSSNRWSASGSSCSWSYKSSSSPLPLPLFLPIPIPISLYYSISIYLSLLSAWYPYHTPLQPLSVAPSLSLFLPLSFSLSLSHTHTLSLSLPLSLIYLSIFRSLYLFFLSSYLFVLYLSIISISSICIIFTPLCRHSP